MKTDTQAAGFSNLGLSIELSIDYLALITLHSESSLIN